jgi:hemoglobin
MELEHKIPVVFSHVVWPYYFGLPIRAEHFECWLKLFIETVDENFSGLKADETKSRAQSIAGVWKFKMGA